MEPNDLAKFDHARANKATQELLKLQEIVLSEEKPSKQRIREFREQADRIAIEMAKAAGWDSERERELRDSTRTEWIDRLLLEREKRIRDEAVDRLARGVTGIAFGTAGILRPFAKSRRRR